MVYSMTDLRPALFMLGVMLVALSFSMCIPAIVDFTMSNLDWQVFLFSAVLGLFAGGALILTNRTRDFHLSIREAVVMTLLIWTILPLFASLPFIYGDLSLSLTDAYFESMSGLTTTGSTVISGLDTAPPGILIWRAFLQWFGGLGIIVMSISILPKLRIGGLQMFKVEAFDVGGRDNPRMALISAGITLIFLSLTVVSAIALWLAGMSGLEASVHAMTTIATGGYSTSDASIKHFDSPLIEAIITVGMISGGIPFLLYFKCLQGNFNRLLGDSQVRVYLSILLFSSLALSAWLVLANGYSLFDAVRYAPFNVVSIMTGTGYASADYTLWGSFPIGLLFFLTFVGGCAGSTACGIKVFRFQILYAMATVQVRRIIYPHAVIVPRYNGSRIEDEIILSVWGFFFLFFMCFAALSLGLSVTGLDLVTSLSSAATAMSNVGPGFGPIVGPSGTFESLSSAAKWLLSMGMLTGRLEVFTVIAIFSRTFWNEGAKVFS